MKTTVYTITLPTAQAKAMEEAARRLGWTLRKIGDYREARGEVHSTMEKRI